LRCRLPRAAQVAADGVVGARGGETLTAVLAFSRWGQASFLNVAAEL
jgi:hypothetical protein